MCTRTRRVHESGLPAFALMGYYNSIALSVAANACSQHKSVTFLAIHFVCKTTSHMMMIYTDAVIEAAVAVPVIFVLLLFLLTAIFTIIAVHKKRRHHDYQQAPQTLNDDE